MAYPYYNPGLPGGGIGANPGYGGGYHTPPVPIGTGHYGSVGGVGSVQKPIAGHLSPHQQFNAWQQGGAHGASGANLPGSPGTMFPINQHTPPTPIGGPNTMFPPNGGGPVGTGQPPGGNPGQNPGGVPPGPAPTGSYSGSYNGNIMSLLQAMSPAKGAMSTLGAMGGQPSSQGGISMSGGATPAPGWSQQAVQGGQMAPGGQQGFAGPTPWNGQPTMSPQQGQPLSGYGPYAGIQGGPFSAAPAGNNDPIMSATGQGGMWGGANGGSGGEVPPWMSTGGGGMGGKMPGQGGFNGMPQQMGQLGGKMGQGGQTTLPFQPGGQTG